MNILISLIFSFCFIHFSLFAKDSWDKFKIQTVEKMASIPGWCAKEKALLIMDLIKENQCRNCIEIGVFAGKSLFPIARTLQYNNSGVVYAVDAWDPLEAAKGYKVSDPHYKWWIEIDLTPYYNNTLQLISDYSLNAYCEVIKASAENAAALFADEMIDFIHLDGNHSDEIVFQDVNAYFPKVKNGGYILLNDAHWLSMMRTLVFLLERTDLVSPFSRSENYLLFRKNPDKVNQANILMNQG